MRSTKEKICRLCLSEAKTEYTAIDDYTVGIITGLRLDLNFYISKEPEMCKDCAEHVQEALIFKAVCLSTEVLVKSFVTETTSKLDLKEVYENKNEGSVDPDNTVCFFCLKCSERSSVIPLNHLKEKQVDCSVIMDPVACPPCATFLTNHLNFVANCTASEQKITKYCESEGTNSHGLINLNNVKKHSGRDNMQDDPHFKQIFINIKEEKSSLDNPTNDTNIDSLSLDPLTSVTCKLEEFPQEVEQKVLLQDIDLTDKNDYECTICEYKTKNSLYLSRHLKTHEDESSVNLFHCDVCSFKTKHQGSIKNHLQLHKNDSEIETYSCTDCDFKTKHKGNLKSHMILHDKSDARMHKCTICSYQTRFKATLKRHLNVHKDTASVPMFKCKICDFSTRYKKEFKNPPSPA
ncbi:hypothetical protein NQ317_007910 [Molorchus minor]|uniref:C2H2-type domain-containing protein n=1 Tax=Molorchus minor TaxID=1323400 RepID=A0ABQ9JSS9_9CUCU|nr:hypothetical protein NQ317_007910 [Molorchus minor]